MTKRTVGSRLMYRGYVGTALLLGSVLGVGEVRADYNIKATEAANFSLVTDSKCNLAEAIASLNAGKSAAGPGLYGCVNVLGGKRIVLEGTGAHYKLGVNGAGIAVTDVEITSKVANRDYIEAAANQRVMLVQSGATLVLTDLTIQRVGTFNAQVLNNQGTLSLNNCVVQGGDAILEGGGIYNNGDLRLSRAKVQNNKTSKNGGGIYSQGSIGVTIHNSTVSNNQSAFSGAGIYSNGSPVVVIASTFSGNRSSSNAGAIYNANETLTLNGVTLQSNTALKNGGGIYNYQGTVFMDGGRLTGAHTAVHGGGIYNYDGDVILTGATIEGASASGDGGGIYHAGLQELNLTESTVQNNRATGSGGGVYSIAARGIYFNGSTISNNTANLTGGGIYSSSRCLGLRSTISTNTAQGNGGGVYSIPGDNEYLELTFVTIGYNKGASGAGVYITHGGTQTRASIVAKNQLPNGTFEDYRGNPHGRDLDNPAGYRSLFGTLNGTTNFFPGPDGDIVGNSNILPLANNGGPTKTHEIPSNSAALNKFVPGDFWTCPATDQRGMPRPRPVGSTCDLGSYERQ